MAKSAKEINQMEYNKKAREKYSEKNFRYQTVKFKIYEITYINDYCKKNNIPKNTLLRQAVMEYIGRPFI